MIQDESYMNITTKVQECQALGMPCVLLYNETGIDNDGDNCDRVSWVNASNSAYEMIGMCMRTLDCQRAKPIYNVE